MRGDFDEDEYDDESELTCFEDTCVCTDGMCGESEADEQEVCADCGRIFSGAEDVCGICGRAMCFGCFEMGAGVCKGPHK